MTSEEFINKLVDVSGKVLNKSRKVILMYLRFMDMAMSKLDYVPVTNGDLDTIAVDGEHVYFNPEYVVEQYKESPERVVRDILHMVMHCVFRHNLNQGKVVNSKYWNVACDIAVENAINELAWDKANDGSFNSQVEHVNNLLDNVSIITAEKIYNHLMSQETSDAILAEYSHLFSRDNHDSWYSPATLAELKAIADGKDPNALSAPGDSDSDEENNESSSDDSSRDESSDMSYQSRLKSLADDWKYIGERMQAEIQDFTVGIGKNAGSLTQNLKEVNREHYDYSSFLKQFAVSCEVMQINNDEFDYIYYSYGMEMYEDMPFIEPLEYKDVKRIHDFVIAIDTSGSTSGEVVQKFVNKTYNILKQAETYSRKYNLHIIQCDTEIQEDAVITCDEELENYIKNMKIRGLGGTSFVPVFEYVDKLINDGAFTELKGLIYFTDGCGVYPAKAPDYKSAFVFIEEEYNDYNVPPWAIKLILRTEDI